MENPFYDSPATKNRKNTKKHFKKKIENRWPSKARIFDSSRFMSMKRLTVLAPIILTLPSKVQYKVDNYSKITAILLIIFTVVP